MSEKMIEVGGKMWSEATLKEALKNHCGSREKRVTLPIISFGTSYEKDDRVIIRLTNSMLEHILEEKSEVIAIDSNGEVLDCSPSPFRRIYYSGITPIFGDF